MITYMHGSEVIAALLLILPSSDYVHHLYMTVYTTIRIHTRIYIYTYMHVCMINICIYIYVCRYTCTTKKT